MARKAKEKLKVFLCHSKSDKEFVRSLYNRLLAVGCDPWLDEVKLLPGQEWDIEIRKAVRNSHVVIICLSKGAISKRGYIHKEIKFAMDVADEIPDGDIFIIPLKVEPCEPPDSLKKYQWTEVFNEGYQKLLNTLTVQANRLKKILPNIENTERHNASTTTSISVHTLSKVVTAFIDNYDNLTLPKIVELLSSDRIALIEVLSPLLLKTESIEQNEKKYWFDILPSMADSSIGTLLEILGNERRKLKQLELKHQQEVLELNKKHLFEWEKYQMNNSSNNDDALKENDISIKDVIDLLDKI